MASITVTCRTGGCGNAGIPIELQTVEGVQPSVVVCGVCSQTINDVRQS